jgi:hypothetical protein
MKVNRTNLLLIGLLIVQIVVGAAFALTGTQAVETSRGPLLGAVNYTPEAVTKIVITDGSDKTRKPLTIARNGADFTLPEYDNYPVDAAKVATLTANLRNLDTRRLIAQNKSSQNRLKVAPDAFDRQLVLRVGDRDVTLYLGTANEASAAYARLSDSDAVYLPSGVSVYDVSANPASWVNTSYLTVAADQIVGLTVENANGKFTFRQDAGTWTLADLAPGERTSTDAVTGLTGQLGTVALAAPIGTKAEDRLGMAKPTVTITIQTRTTLPPTAPPPPTATSAVPLPAVPTSAPPTLGTPATPAFEEKTVTLLIGAKLENGNYVLKSSESLFYIEVAPTFATPFLELSRTKAVITPPTLTPTPFGPLAPPTLTPTGQGTVAATVAATQAATQAATIAPTQTETPAATQTATVPPTSTATETSTPTSTP